MSSDRQIDANRRNATKSTGPRTMIGQEVSRRNARRHGLAVHVHADPALKSDLEKLALALSLPSDAHNVNERALKAAGAELDLLRIRKIRASLLNTLNFDSQATLAKMTEVNDKLEKLERYERRAFSRRKRALRELCRVQD
jgi:enoyl-CoA hydratase/carnithine racemase